MGAVSGDNAATLLFAAILFAAPGRAAETGLLEPTGPWNVDYAEHQCVASRPYESKEGPLHFLVKPSPSSDVMQIALVKRGGGPSKGIQVDTRIIMGSAPAVEAKQLSYATAAQFVRLINLDQSGATALGKANHIVWDASGALLSLRLGDMASVMSALADCRLDLAKYWNIGPEFAAALKSLPKPKQPILSLFSFSDYPEKAVREEQSGTTRFILLIDERGALRDCMVVETSGIAVLDAQTCLVIKARGKFDPAIGADGKPARASLTQRVRWELGE